MNLYPIVRVDAPRVVYVEFECFKIGDIDTMNEKYYAEFIFNVSSTENKMISEYDKNKGWNPIIFIDNIMGKADETIEYKTAINNSSGYTVITEKRVIKVSV